MKNNTKKRTKATPGPDSKLASMEVLKFGTGNVKLTGSSTATFSLPAGITCPGAKECFSYFDRGEKRITDGRHTAFRCYAASLEASFPSVRASVDYNQRLLKEAKTVEAMADLIERSLPAKAWVNIRVHAHGDFYSGDYFLAWMEAARRDPKRNFYAYTKSLPHWIRYREMIPKNFVLNASMGGKFDHLIKEHKLKHSIVVFHPEVAAKLKLEIDHDDSLARDRKVKRFALLIHGTQPANSNASAAIKRMKVEGVRFSYAAKPSLTSINV